jgi:hypothetical protein
MRVSAHLRQAEIRRGHLRRPLRFRRANHIQTQGDGVFARLPTKLTIRAPTERTPGRQRHRVALAVPVRYLRANLVLGVARHGDVVRTRR